MGIDSEVGMNSRGLFAQARLRSGQGRTSAVSGYRKCLGKDCP